MLPSQNARPSASRAHMYRRGKGRPWFALAGGAAVILVGFFVVKWIVGGSEPANADASTPPAQSEVAVATPEKPDAPSNDSRAGGGTNAPKPATPPDSGKSNEPVKIAMGGSMPGVAANANPKPTPKPTPQPTPQTDPKTNPPAAPAAPPKTPPASAGNTGAGASPQTLANSNPQPPAAQTPPKPPELSNTPVSQRVQIGLDLIKQNRPVEARKMLSEALGANGGAGVSPAEADRIRAELTKINERLIFSPEVASNDAFASAHQIASGETLAKIAKKLNVAVDWRFLQRINQISDPAKIRVGQRLKIVKGPFHVIIDKRTFRADLYMGDGSDRVFVRSLQVGLGEFGATPEGAFAVKPDSKLINPAWTNPRTGESFQPNDPKNPLGEYWIGLIGASENIRGLETYGIHGTIDPASIGKEQSMGCVRLRDEDIKLLYEVLTEQTSRVEIHGNDWP